jgi:hypothetical protein
MIGVGTFLAFLAVVFFLLCGVSIEEDESGGKMGILFIFGLASIVGSNYVFYHDGFSSGKKEGMEAGIEIGMRERLNEPVDDISRLYGYAVRNKSYHKERINDETPERAKYLLELKDVISNFRVRLSKVEITKEVYHKVESGRIYPEELETELTDPSPP